MESWVDVDERRRRGWVRELVCRPTKQKAGPMYLKPVRCPKCKGYVGVVYRYSLKDDSERWVCARGCGFELDAKDAQRYAEAR